MTRANFRLAFRVEGKYWNAYFAKSDSMDDSVLLGSIRLAVVEISGERKEQFMNLMRETFGDVAEAACGERPIWDAAPVRAPEHERADRA